MGTYINVMWIDDEYDQPQWMSFIKKCKVLKGINIIPFKTSRAGMNAFKKSPKHFDAIILDAKVFNDSEDEQTTTVGLYNSMNVIREMEIRNNCHIPVFIFTGQPDLMDSENFKYSVGGRVYIKGNYSGMDSSKMIEDILSEVSNTESVAIRKKYTNIFSWIPEIIEDEMLDILKISERNETTNADVFNKIRKIIEWLMFELFYYGLLTDYKGAKLQECSKFLNKKSLNAYVPIYVRRSIHSLSEITNDASHDSPNGIDREIKEGKAPFLIKSTVYELLNILFWFHNLPQDKETKTNIRTAVKNATSESSK